MADRRRSHGSGSVYQRADGRWMGTIEAGFTSSGARRRVAVTAKTKAECRKKLVAKQNQIAAEGLPSVSARVTVQQWSVTWLEMTQMTLRPRPWATGRSAVKQWIIPTIGHKRLEQLSPADIRAVAQAQRKAGRSSSTALRTHVVLTSMLRAAIAEGHQVPRRVLEVKAPAKAVSDRTAMSIPEALAMLQVASHLPHGSRWAMAFLHGMRQGELLGLTWDNVDLDAGLVTVRWELQALPYVEPRNPASGFRIPEGLEVRHLVDGYHLLPPKTRAGFRMVPLVPAMREALADWREIAPDNPWGLVWPTAAGRPANDKHDRQEWYALQGSAGVGHPAGRYYFPHEARHTTATQLLESGVDPHQITALMGHSSILTTRGYQHPGARPALAALEAVAGALELRPRPGA